MSAGAEVEQFRQALERRLERTGESGAGARWVMSNNRFSWLVICSRQRTSTQALGQFDIGLP